ncbi:MAG: hypothetical protein EOP67_70420 [Sphingomonas sp.]|nr:MAG: hypothetical protein EOP67_70420 [Sphingomonas sp.]
MYGNRGPVTLSVNGVAIGTQSLDDHIARWTGVTLRPGENRIEASAGEGGGIVRDSVTWHYSPEPAVGGADYPIAAPKP